MNLELIAKSASQLFSLPEICIKLQDLIYDPSSSMQDIAQLISMDPSLSARLLKIANSSFYSFPSQIDSLPRAITLIGTADLYSLALATTTPDTFNALSDSEHIDINHFWQHSVITGLASRQLAQDMDIRHSEGYFLTGLFHNLGQLVILEQMPERYLEVLAAQSSDKEPWQVEQELLGFTYAQAGEALLKCWNMPTHITDMVAWQHEPDGALDPRSAAILHIASRASHQLQQLNDSGFDYHQSITPKAWALTGIQAGEIEQAMGMAQTNCQAMLSAMTGKQLPAS